MTFFFLAEKNAPVMILETSCQALSRGGFSKRTPVGDLHGTQLGRDLQGSYGLVLLAREKGMVFLLFLF